MALSHKNAVNEYLVHTDMGVDTRDQKIQTLEYELECLKVHLYFLQQYGVGKARQFGGATEDDKMNDIFREKNSCMLKLKDPEYINYNKQNVKGLKNAVNLTLTDGYDQAIANILLQIDVVVV